MDEYTPSMSEVEGAYVAWRLAVTDGNEDERSEEFARMLAAHDRVVAANAWDDCKARLWHEVRGLPYWRDPATGHSEFDLQPLGPDMTSEKSARVLIVGIFDDVSNPYRITEENN